MYLILIQKNDTALGVYPKTFYSYGAIEDFMDKHYPGHFYSTDWADSERVKQWIQKFGRLSDIEA